MTRTERRPRARRRCIRPALHSRALAIPPTTNGDPIFPQSGGSVSAPRFPKASGGRLVGRSQGCELYATPESGAALVIKVEGCFFSSHPPGAREARTKGSCRHTLVHAASDWALRWGRPSGGADCNRTGPSSFPLHRHGGWGVFCSTLKMCRAPHPVCCLLEGQYPRYRGKRDPAYQLPVASSCRGAIPLSTRRSNDKKTSIQDLLLPSFY